MSAPVGILRPNPKKLIEDIEAMMEAFRQIRDIAGNESDNAEDCCADIYVIADEILWPG